MTEKKAVPLRLNPDVMRALEAWAAEEFRSTNGQIEYLLHHALVNANRIKNQPSAKKKS
jgi:hypothetical protein